MTQPTRKINILLFGVDPRAVPPIYSSISSSLCQRVPGAGINLYVAETREKATLRIESTPLLDIVHLNNGVRYSRLGFSEACSRIAAALAKHENHPMVVIEDMSLNFVQTVFREKKLRVTNAMADQAILARIDWLYQPLLAK